MNAVEILSNALIEYPKHPARGDLVAVIHRSGISRCGYPVAAPEDYTPDNICACLLGQVLLSAEVDPRKADYPDLLDGNGIEEAIKFLWEAIAGEPYPDALSISDAYRDVYRFNDGALAAGESSAYSAAGGIVRSYTPESVETVTDKIRAALDLAKAAQ